MPTPEEDAEFRFCRQFGVAAKPLRGNRWVLQVLISTVTLDGRTLDDYYRNGEVHVLAGMIRAKQLNRVNRRNRPVTVRVFRDESTPFQLKVGVLDLDGPGSIVGHGSLSRHEQAGMAGGTVRCRPFNSQPVDVPLSELRLILDTQITRSDHSETI